MAGDPQAVWKLIQKADDYVKYAHNRDPKTAYAQARAVLGEAAALAEDLDAGSRDAMRAQIATRRDDIDRFEQAG